MIQDESQGPLSQLQQQAPPQQQQGTPQNPLGKIMQGGGGAGVPQNITKHQVIAGLHHLDAVQKAVSPLLRNPALGKSNIRPKLFDAMATLIGQGTMTVPEVINGIKDLPDDPFEQKKWLEQKMMQTAQAEQKLISDYIAQGPGPEPQGPEWSPETHKDHMAGLLGNYKRG